MERKARKGAQRMEKRENENGEAPSPDENGNAVAEAKEPEKATKTGTLAALGLYLFVAIPLPGTGAWTGSLIAALFGMKKSRALVTVFLGVLTAGVIMTLASYGVVSAFKFFAK